MLGFIPVAKDRRKAQAILETAELILERTQETDQTKYASLVLKDYYETIRELMSVVLLLDGISAQGESSHKILIEYIQDQEIFRADDMRFIHELRMLRHKISYDGHSVDSAYLSRNVRRIERIVTVLKAEIEKKL